MPFKKKEELRKGELTSMIDVIFLLLIFFLVTLAAGIKPQEEQSTGIPEKRKERPIVRQAIEDTNYTLRVSVNVIEEKVIEEDQGQGYQVFFLDSVFKNDIEVEQKVPKLLTQKEDSLKIPNLSFIQQEKLRKEVEELKSYLPAYLPSKWYYNNNRERFDELYDQVLSRIEEKITAMSEKQKDQENKKIIKVFLDMDRNVYYKFLVDMNDLYFKLKPNKHMNITSQDNLYINVNYSGNR